MVEPITMTFYVDEINTILAGLGNMPYVQSAKLIEKIQDDYKTHITAKEIKDEAAKASTGAA